MNLDAQVALLYQMGAGASASVWREIQSEEDLAMTEVDARQSVSFIISHFTSRGEQVEVASNERRKN